MKKTILIGINPDFSDMGVCIYVPEEGKPFRKVTSKELILFSSGELTSQIKWINETLRSKKLSIKQSVVVVGTNGVDLLDYWSSLKSKVQAFGKFQSGAFQESGRPTIISDVQTEFIAIANGISEATKRLAAGKVIAKLLEAKEVPIIELHGQIDHVFTDYTLTNDKRSERKAGSLVLGKNMIWAEEELEELKAIWGKRPASYPSFQNGGEYIINRQT